MIKQSPNCEIYEPLVSAMLDGELSRCEKQVLQNHLDGCTGCRKRLDAFARVDETVGLLSKASGNFAAPVAANVAAISIAPTGQLAKKRLTFSVWRLIPLAVAATVLLCLGITMLPSPNPVTAEQISPEEIVRPLTELHFINLQQRRDQELMLRTLGMDLRSLRLEIAQLETGTDEQKDLTNQVNAMIEKVRKFELQTPTQFE